MRLVFFDDGMRELAPLTDLRPAFDVRTGPLTTLERWRETLSATTGTLTDLFALFVPEHLAAITRERHNVAVNDLPSAPGTLLLVNARCPLPTPAVSKLTPGQIVLEKSSGQIAAAFVDHAIARELMFSSRYPKQYSHAVNEQLLITRPWSVRSFRDRCLAHDLSLIAARNSGTKPPPGVTVIGEHPLLIDPGATVFPATIFDTTAGPISLAAGAIVRPGAILIGPCSVGEGSTVLERATIRPGTAIGPSCKVNGEIGGTIFQGFANKAHDGYLGDSYIGEWVNLGAGTTNSNLLNTYGEIISVAQPGSGYERTGEQFLGAVIGDHVKTAICTRLMTGCVLHTGSMFATTAAVSGCVKPFSWATDDGTRTYKIDKFLDVMKAAMGRRKLVASPAYTARIQQLHAALGS
jgi:UDP-N-acetylglucosamine diphosphorylase / glucose-1-phosphate thymidylyltransferase / UDP-N-acetylgalactosamine diphosphorylase / glucosamine-1-phosphate N-acetyltransferase / galactosamine-1-phosphate N-acetyltransferase